MPAESVTIAHTVSEQTTEGALANDIRLMIEDKYDASEPVRTFRVKVCVEEIEVGAEE